MATKKVDRDIRIGDIVNYFFHDTMAKGATPTLGVRPAIVVFINDEGGLNLRVFTNGEQDTKSGLGASMHNATDAVFVENARYCRIPADKGWCFRD